MRSMRKLIVIVGQTATGKSGLAVKLAKKFNGEVISADSRQVYRGLDIGSAKITKKEMDDIPHHLLDVVPLRKIYTAAEYTKDARHEIKKVWQRGKLPILCGGTGFYIQAVVDGIALPGVKPSLVLRKKLGKKTADELFTILKQKDLMRAGNIDQHNKRRLIRALEIAETVGRVPNVKANPLLAETLFIGIALSKDVLKRNIEKRIKVWLRAGLLAETRRLLKTRLSASRFRELGIVYIWALKILKNEVNRKEFITGLTRDLMKYAKRQMTWFKREKRIHWIENKKDAFKLARTFIKA